LWVVISRGAGVVCHLSSWPRTQFKWIDRCMGGPACILSQPFGKVPNGDQYGATFAANFRGACKWVFPLAPLQLALNAGIVKLP
jgi:hypothetical protein